MAGARPGGPGALDAGRQQNSRVFASHGHPNPASPGAPTRTVLHAATYRSGSPRRPTEAHGHWLTRVEIAGRLNSRGRTRRAQRASPRADLPAPQDGRPRAEGTRKTRRPVPGS